MISHKTPAHPYEPSAWTAKPGREQWKHLKRTSVVSVQVNNLPTYSKRETIVYQTKGSWSGNAFSEKQGDKQIRKNTHFADHVYPEG